MEVTWARGGREKNSLLRSWCRPGIRPLLHILLARASHKTKSQGQISEVGKKAPHLSGRRCEATLRKARMWGQGTGSHCSLSHLRFSLEPLKSLCEGGVTNPIFQMRKLRLREFHLFFPLFLLSQLGIAICWALMALRHGCDPDIARPAWRKPKTQQQTQGYDPEGSRGHGKSTGPGSVLGVPGCVSLGNALDLSEPWFPHVCGGAAPIFRAGARSEGEVSQCLPNLRAQNHLCCCPLPHRGSLSPNSTQAPCPQPGTQEDPSWRERHGSRDPVCPHDSVPGI